MVTDSTNSLRLFDNDARLKPFTVTGLTRRIREVLERQFPFIWVEGEISNLRTPVSGHHYFTLKDEFSQIRAVLFKTQQKLVPFELEDGLMVICQGRVSVYEPRGEYQILVEILEPKGLGALQLAFEQLKQKLEKEGLFAPSLKKPIPYLPQRLAVVTSPTGAAIRDFLKVVKRRFANVEIFIYPVRVQGEGAGDEIASAIYDLNKMENIDVIILARGGGSIEDLWAFNEEIVARAIYESSIPVISAIGHEIDFTIADFVADLRAPTPSAAAELVVRQKDELAARIQDMGYRLRESMLRIIRFCRDHLHSLGKRLIDPRRRLEETRIRLDDLVGNTEIRIHHIITLARERLIKEVKRLDALSPLAVLGRGYSITRTLPDLKVITDVSSVRIDDMINVKVARGEMVCKVKEKDGKR